MSDMIQTNKKRWLEGMGTPVKKLVLNQFGAAVLGIMLSSAAMQSRLLNFLTSLLAVFFYLFLQYTAIWEIGAKDRIRVDGGRAAENKWRGLYAATLSNSPNILFAIFIIVLTTVGVLTQWSWAGESAVVFTFIARLWQGMYNGIINFVIPQGLNEVQTIFSTLIYLAILLPSLAVNAVGYRMGYMNRRIFPERKKKD